MSEARKNILFAFAILLLLLGAWVAHNELLILYVSVIFAVVLTPVVTNMQTLHIRTWHPGRGLCVLALLLFVIGLLVLFFTFAVPPIQRDLRSFIEELPTRGPQSLDRLRRVPLLRHADLSSMNAKFQDIASNLAAYAFTFVKLGAGKLFDLITGIVLTIYFILDGERAYRWIMAMIPETVRLRLDITLRRAEQRMGRWLLGQLTLMLLLGLTSLIVFLTLKIRYAYALAVLMGLFNIVPVIGALVSISIVAVVAALDSWGRVIGVLAFMAIYGQIENAFFTPRIMQKSVDLPGLAVIISLLLGSALAGIPGAVVAVPTAVLVAVLVDEYLVKHDARAADAKVPVKITSR
jgi:predicted PurR-regulated permease PerM